MRGKDRVIVAVILVAALAVGLAVVNRALGRAEQARAEATVPPRGSGSGDSGASGEDISGPGGSIGPSGEDVPGPGGSIGSSGEDVPGPGGSAGTSGEDVPGPGGSTGTSGENVPGSGGSAGAPGEDVPGPGGSAGASGENAPGSGEAGAAGEDPAGAGAPGESGSGSGTTAGAAGEDPSGAGTGGALAGAAEVLAAGGASDGEALTALGLLDEGALPAMEADAATLESLTEWMQTGSAEGLAASAALAEAQAVASGAGGNAADAERRAFAQSQGEDNYRAELNRISEKAASLGLDYLKYRDLAALQEENVAFYRDLSGRIQAQADAAAGEQEALQSQLDALKESMEDAEGVALVALQAQVAVLEAAQGKAGQVQADAEQAAAALAKAELDLQGAQKDLETARQALNAALGREVTAPMTVEGELVRSPLPTLTEEEAVAQALQNRNEIKGAAFAIVLNTKLLEQLRYRAAPDSPEYIEQEAALQEAQASFPTAQKEVEADVRNRFGRLQLAAGRLDLAEGALEKSGLQPPEEAYKVKGPYEGGEWSSNAAALTAKWAEIFGNRQQKITGTADLDLAVLQLEHAVGVGSAVAGF